MGVKILKEIDKSPAISLWGDRVLVQLEKEEITKTASGLYVPASKNDDGKTHRAVVVKISPFFAAELEEDKFATLEVGNVVLISLYAGSDVTLGLEAYKVLRATDIMGTLEEE